MDLCSFCSSLDLRYAGYYQPSRHGRVSSDAEEDEHEHESHDGEGDGEESLSNEDGERTIHDSMDNEGNDQTGESGGSGDGEVQHDDGNGSENEDEDDEEDEEYEDEDEEEYEDDDNNNNKCSVIEMLERANFCRFCAAMTGAFKQWLDASWKGREDDLLLADGQVTVGARRAYTPYSLDPQGADDDGGDGGQFSFAFVTLLIRDPDNPESDNVVDWVGFERPFQRIRPDPPRLDQLLDAMDAGDDAMSVWQTVEPYYGRRRLESVDMRLLRRWKETCYTCHGDTCRSLHMHEEGDGSGKGQLDAKYRPKMIRLIDVDRMCLVETADDTITWTALSYVWGLKKFTTLTSHNLAELKIPGALSVAYRLPQTVADAIAVTRGLGERYLWTDSLCIVQDLDADKAAFIPAMDVIYGLASITIVDLAGQSAFDGLAGVQRPRPPPPDPIEVNGVWVLPAPVPTATGFSNPRGEHLGRYLSRGWTFQEVLLSQRFVVFTPEVVFWECRCATWREDANWEVVAAVDDDDDDGDDDDDTDKIDIFRNSFVNIDSSVDYRTLWARDPDAFDASYQDLVFDYSHRELTYDSDGLAAIAGVLSALTRAAAYDEITFAWALPRPYLGVALTWPANYDGEGDDRARPGGTFYRRTAPCLVDRGRGGMVSVPFPSWSWVGWVGPLLFQELFGTLRSEHAGLRYYMLSPPDSEADGFILEEIPQNNSFHPKYPTAGHHERAPPLWKGSSTEMSADMVPAALRHDVHIQPAVLAFWSSCAVLRFTYDPRTWHGDELVRGVALYQYDSKNDSGGSSSGGSSVPYRLPSASWMQRPDRWKAGDYEAEFIVVGRNNLENIRQHSELVAILAEKHVSGARSRVAAVSVNESEWNGIPHRRWEPVFLV